MTTRSTTLLKDQVSTSNNELGTIRPFDELNTLLADMQVMRQYLLNFHWNVTGDQFLELHPFFESQYESMNMQVDDLAERIKLLKVWPIGTMALILKHARIVEPGMPLEAREMLRRYLLDLRSMNEHIGLLINSAAKQNDHGTADLLTEILRNQEKSTWKIEMLLQ